MVGNAIFDPCFLVDAKAVVCGDTPAKPSNSAFKLKLTKPLPKPDTQPEDPSSAFLVELSDGTVCNFLTGATGAIDGKRINYACNTGGGGDTVIIGALQPGVVWMAERAVLSPVKTSDSGGPPLSAKSRQMVPVRTVWR